MTMRFQETIATVLVLIALVGVPLFVYIYQHGYIMGQYPPQAKVFTLTGVAKDGVWTLESVTGENYGRKTFSPGTINLEEGDEVVLRLQSADVHHRFYAPTLGVGPLEVEAGHTVEARFKADKTGTHQYYCTLICGDCHFYMMQGWITVVSPGEKAPETPEVTLCSTAIFEEAPRENRLEWGRYLHQKMGCIRCHGVKGQGGVVNLNYIRKTVPAHNTLAEKFFLEEREDADVFIRYITRLTGSGKPEEQPDIPRFVLVRTQFEAAKELIREGKVCAKFDLAGPEPPLQMPSWKVRLIEYDIDSILAYLITLYPWEEEEEEEVEEVGEEESSISLIPRNIQ